MSLHTFKILGIFHSLYIGNALALALHNMKTTAALTEAKINK